MEEGSVVEFVCLCFEDVFFAHWLVMNNRWIKRRNDIFDEKEGSE